MVSLSHSPASSIETHSDSECPRFNKQLSLNTQQIHPGTKQHRSSSINSICSTQSTHQRSLSWVSLESPRNSIVSIDDIFLRPTRNNSNTSLASLGGMTSPKEIPKDNISLATRLPKGKLKSSCVVLSDEDISEPEHNSIRSVAWRRKSSEKVQKPTFLPSLKRDFKFKYDKEVKQKPLTSNPINTSLPINTQHRLLDDSQPSPLALTSEVTQPAATPLKLLEDDTVTTHSRTSVTAKKARSSSMTQSMFLKKKLLLSKDLQLELLSGHQSPFPSPAATVADTRYPFPSVKLPMPTRDLIHNFLSSHGNEPMPQQPLSPLAHDNTHNLAHSLPVKPGNLSPQPSSPPTQVLANGASGENVVRDQSDLLSKFNRKWNKTYFPAHPEGDLNDSLSNSMVPTKKRSRSELVSSTDSFSIGSTK